MERRLRQHRFTGEQRTVELRLQTNRPVVMHVAAADEGDEKALGDSLHFLENPFRTERPFGASGTQPAHLI